MTYQHLGQMPPMFPCPRRGHSSTKAAPSASAQPSLPPFVAYLVAQESGGTEWRNHAANPYATGRRRRHYCSAQVTEFLARLLGFISVRLVSANQFISALVCFPCWMGISVVSRMNIHRSICWPKVGLKSDPHFTRVLKMLCSSNGVFGALIRVSIGQVSFS